MWIPFQWPAESMKDADKAGNKISAFIQLVEKEQDDTSDCLEKSVSQGGSSRLERKGEVCFYLNFKTQE